MQGSARRPATPWTDDIGARAGLVHQERGFAYVLFTGAGHLVPQWKPAQALVFLREFVLGANRTGTFEDAGDAVAGGEDPALAGAYMLGGLEIHYGSGRRWRGWSPRRRPRRRRPPYLLLWAWQQ